MPLSQEGLVKAKELIARYPKTRSAMLPLLFLVQAEEGYVSPAGVAEVAELLGVTKAEVGAVATFYTMYHRRPAGKYVVSVCRTLSCQMRGSDEVTAALLERCGTELHGTTDDGMVTVEEVECLAACDGAPVVQVNYENYERLTPERATALADALLRDEVPPPTFAERGSVTEPSSAAAYWRLADPLSEPPPRLTGQPEPEPVPATAFPDQPPAPSDKADPTTRPVEELRTGADHAGAPGGEPLPEAPAAAAGPEPDGEAAQQAGSGTARRRRRGRRPAGTAEPSVDDAATDTEAQAPQPDAQAQDAAAPEPSAGARPRGRQPRDVAEEAGPHQREEPGGEPQ
jgi:NADH-quinone oxidoreductase subunit E